MNPNQKIFNVGLPKTGTSSLAQALNLLGIQCLHNPFHLRGEVMRGNFRFDSTPDWQAIANFGEHFYPQLDQAYPGSKFILTERELESWLKSIERQISRSDGMAPRKRIGPRDLLRNPMLLKWIYDSYHGNNMKCGMATRGLIFLAATGFTASGSPMSIGYTGGTCGTTLPTVLRIF